MSLRRLNPFRYGRPVPPQHFIGRQEALGTLFSRLRNGDSTAVVGEPHIGKSSLLRYIADGQVYSGWLTDADAHLFIEMDCQLFPQEQRPADFWRVVVDEIDRAFPDPALHALIRAVRDSDFGSHALDALFRALGKRGRRAVLLIDEFDVLLNHPNFNKAEFFGALRSLASRTEGLALITATRMAIAQMNARSHEINPLGSPFFNTVTEVPLLPLRDAEVESLLEGSLRETEVTFSEADRGFIRRLAGRHPYLVQVAAAALFDASVHAEQDDRLPAAGELFYQRIASHFDDLWRHLESRAQTALVILALAELRGNVDRRNFDTSDLGKLDQYGPELRRLEGLGMVEREGASGWHADWGNFVLWHGNRWRITSGSFVYWVADNIIAGTRKTIGFEQWLEEREFDGLLTQMERKKLKEMATKIPRGAIVGIGDFVRMVFRHLFSRSE